MFNDLRGLIKKAEAIGECEIIEGADWNAEIGAVTDLLGEKAGSSLLVFDKIKGYPAGYRVATNLATTDRRIALCYGLPETARGIELVRAMRDRLKDSLRPLPPVEVGSGPIQENIFTGADVDLYKFPSPVWHEQDGGRYIGTGSAVVTRDPEEGWVNLGTYRVQVQDKNTVTIVMAGGHHGQMMAKKYWAQKQPCPVAVCCGQAPLIYAAAHLAIPWGLSEYNWVGGWQRKPVEVVKGPVTGLPIPATAEIVLEGEMVPPEVETRPEGPFGDWTGHYDGGISHGIRPMPAVHIKSVLHRNEPIIQGSPPSVLPRVWTLGRHVLIAATLWNELDRQIPGVQGVSVLEEASIHSVMVISLKQMYGGHAKQAALLAAGALVTGYALRYVIVVDEDVDPTSTSQVLWALGTRSEPVDNDIIRGCWGSWSNPMLTPQQREIDDREHSVGLILACKPYKWIKDFSPAVRNSPEIISRVKSRWPRLFR